MRGFPKFLAMVFTGMTTSMFIFPFEFWFLPGVNTKMVLAAIGLIVSLLMLARRGSLTINKNLLLLFVIAGIASLIGMIAVNYNHTDDYAYATYIVSFAVWMSAAFVVCCLIRAVHNRIDVPLVVYYLLAVCVFQCVVSMMIDRSPSVQLFVDAYILQDQDLLHRVGRLYGIGAQLDIAGARFSAVLVLAAVVLPREKDNMTFAQIILVLLSLIVIGVVGNMIARTTIVGVIMSIVYWIALWLFGKTVRSDGQRSLSKAAILLLVVLFPTTVFLYRTDKQVRHQLRFGFEGFFSLAEKGRWEVSSNEILQSMVVFPDNLRTWIIGDGYFENPRNDVNYLGDSTKKGFYMGTDVGYLRFIFYFGIFGMLTMVAVMACSAYICARGLPEYKWMFILLLVVTLVVWFKVSTDIFPAFALMICTALMAPTNPEWMEN